MNWCCNPFRNAAANRCGEGFVLYVVAPERPEEEPQFGLAFRAVTLEDYPQWQAAAERMAGNGNLKLTGAFRLAFCPWCGVRLADHYRSSYEEFVNVDLRREFDFE